MSLKNHVPPYWIQSFLAVIRAFDSVSADGLTVTFPAESVRFCKAWAAVEQSAAVENPINTTYGLSGSTLLEGNSAGVRHYQSEENPWPIGGIAATALTIGRKAKGTDGVYRLVYGGLLNDLQKGEKTAEQIAEDNGPNLLTWSNDPAYQQKLKDALRTIS